MEIHFISSLAAEDEDKLAPALLLAFSSLLDQCSIAYTLRIQTSRSKVFQHHHPAAGPASPDRASHAGVVDRWDTPLVRVVR